MNDIIELLKSVFKDRIVINQEEVILDGKKYQFDVSAARDLVFDEYNIMPLTTKKEVYQKLLSLSELYLTSMKQKEKRAFLKEVIPNIDYVVAAFFDMSKYCSNEHIFDGVSVAHLSYDDLLSLAPRILRNLKDNRRLEKKKELEHYFDECETLKDCFVRIEELKKVKDTYQDICSTFDDFFAFYQISKKDLDETKTGKYTYDSLFHLFLNQSISKKKKEIEEENKEYKELLEQYQDLLKKKRILEIAPAFKEIKKLDTSLKKEKNQYVKEEREQKNNIKQIELHKKECEEEQREWERGSFLKRFFTSKTKKNLELEMTELTESEEEIEKQLKELSKKKDSIKKEMNLNEKNLSKLCDFDITISDFESKIKSLCEEQLTMKQLEEKQQNMEQVLMKFHIEKKEEELEEICQAYHVSSGKEK